MPLFDYLPHFVIRNPKSAPAYESSHPAAEFSGSWIQVGHKTLLGQPSLQAKWRWYTATWPWHRLILFHGCRHHCNDMVCPIIICPIKLLCSRVLVSPWPRQWSFTMKTRSAGWHPWCQTLWGTAARHTRWCCRSDFRIGIDFSI